MPYKDTWLECEWLKHPFHEDICVSDNGRVLSYKSGKWHELRPGLSGRGYLTISIGHNKTVPVHRLVAQTFLPNEENKPCVNHINGVKTDNRALNLEWVTHGENEMHAYRTGLKEPHHIGRRIRVLETGEVFNSIRECADAIGGNGPGISRCLSKGRSTHRNLHFEYVDKEVV